MINYYATMENRVPKDFIFFLQMFLYLKNMKIPFPSRFSLGETAIMNLACNHSVQVFMFHFI